ncbi:hypothetical protein HGM15179_000683 [Zosterops borbonicus]|uniref:Uncharacterized protein n=1 Tax=Zosterops borbonicus TaxID=364589 RepID=A0A8K1LU30_9PASS|nr:hypothetical protein HGM15179_000683 [Zosterops borbonicus]
MHVGRVLRHKYRLGKKWIESSPEEKNSGVLVDKNLKMTQPSALAPQKANCILDCIKRILTSRAKDMILPLYFLLLRLHLENCIQLWDPQQRRDIDLLERVQRRTNKIIRGIENLFCEEPGK